MREFTVPRNVFYGYGAIEGVTKIPAKRAMIVSDQIMAGLGWVERVQQILEDAGTDVRVFAGVEPDPSRDMVAVGAEVMSEFEPEVVIGLGGGSSIDAGKAMWVFYEMPDTDWEVVSVPFSLPPMRAKARYIAVPSTSGTGTEVGIGAVITDKAATPPVKKSIDSYELTPDIAIIDPELCLTMPADVTANTGMDVISHALEGYVAAGANEFSDGLCLRALQLVFEWLPRAVADGSDREAREQMHYASTAAGLGFNNSGLGITHSLAHQLGAVWGVPHGRANALMLPHVVAFNAVESGARYAEVARVLGVGQDDVDESVEALIDKLLALGDEVGMPRSTADVNIPDEQLEAALDGIAQHAVEDACTGDNVRQPTADDMKYLYLRSREGSTPRVSS